MPCHICVASGELERKSRSLQQDPSTGWIGGGSPHTAPPCVKVSKKSISEISIFELTRPENCLSMLCALDPLAPPPPTHTPKLGEKHMKRGQNMLYIGYLIILDGQSMEKINFRKFYCLRQVHLAENLPRATHTQNRVETT